MNAKLEAAWTGLKTGVGWVLDHLSLVLGLLLAGSYLWWKKESDELAEERAARIAAEQRGKISELEKETKQAEQEAGDSRADYERLAAEHRPSKD